jgi:hypothetical protein
VKFVPDDNHEDRFFVLNGNVEEIGKKTKVALRVGDTIKFYADRGQQFVVGVLIEPISDEN